MLPDVGDFDTSDSFSIALWVRVPDNANGALLARMDEAADYRGWDVWMQNGRIGTHIVSAWPKDALKAVTQTPLPANRWTHVVITYDGSARLNGLKIYVDGQSQSLQAEAKELKGSIRTQTPLRLGQRSASAGPANSRLQDLRIYNRVLNIDETNLLRSRPRLFYLRGKVAPRSPEEDAELYEQYLASFNENYQQAVAAKNATKTELDQLISRGTIAHVMQEKPEQPMAFILFRGEYDKRRDQVQPATPDTLPPFPNDLPRNRLGLAKWLTLPDNPLYARVTVNRFWQEVFGTGIVRTSGDFGVTGEMPSHPELLDWLALDFRDNGWNVKAFFRQLVTRRRFDKAHRSRQRNCKPIAITVGSRAGHGFAWMPKWYETMLWPPVTCSCAKQGGPSVKPYQPPGVWEAVAMIGSNTRDYREDQGENIYRRSLYTFWKRSAPPASMDIFNAPSRETCTVRRERTNTPLQALVTLNDPQYVRSCQDVGRHNHQSLS